MKQTTTIINGKKYTVEHVFNMVSNWYFTDKNGVAHLVDGEDITVWGRQNHKKWEGVKTVIEYAKEIASQNDGVFWWTVKTA